MPVCLLRAVISTHISVVMGWLRAAEALWWGTASGAYLQDPVPGALPCPAPFHSRAAELPLPGATQCSRAGHPRASCHPSLTRAPASFFLSLTAPPARTAPTVLIEGHQPPVNPCNAAVQQLASAKAECAGRQSPLAADY